MNLTKKMVSEMSGLDLIFDMVTVDGFIVSILEFITDAKDPEDQYMIYLSMRRDDSVNGGYILSAKLFSSEGARVAVWNSPKIAGPPLSIETTRQAMIEIVELARFRTSGLISWVNAGCN